MDKLTNPAPPPLTFDRKKEGYKTKDGDTICRPKPQKPPDPSYAKGGRVKKTGCAKLHKDEIVLPVSLVKQLAKLVSLVKQLAKLMK